MHFFNFFNLFYFYKNLLHKINNSSFICFAKNFRLMNIPHISKKNFNKNV